MASKKLFGSNFGIIYVHIYSDHVVSKAEVCLCHSVMKNLLLYPLNLLLLFQHFYSKGTGAGLGPGAGIYPYGGTYGGKLSFFFLIYKTLQHLKFKMQQVLLSSVICFSSLWCWCWNWSGNWIRNWSCTTAGCEAFETSRYEFRCMFLFCFLFLDQSLYVMHFHYSRRSRNWRRNPSSSRWLSRLECTYFQFFI